MNQRIPPFEQAKLERKLAVYATCPVPLRYSRRYGTRILNGLELWKHLHDNTVAYAAAKADAREIKNLLNNALNFPIQGLAASVINRAAIAIARQLKDNDYSAYLCMQVHDQLVYNVPSDEIEPVSAIIQHEMETAIKLDVPLRAQPIAADRFGKCK